MTPWNLDVRTMLLMLCLGNFAALALGYFHRQVDMTSFRFYLVAKVVQTSGWALLFLRDRIPDLLSIQIGNSLLFTGLALEAWTLCRVGRKGAIWRPIYVGLVLGGVSLFWIVGNSPVHRVVVASVEIAAIYGAASVGMLVGRGRLRLHRILGVLCLFLCLAMGVRAIAAGCSNGGTLFSSSPIQVLTFLAFFMFMLVGGTGFMLLLLEQGDRQLRESEKKFSTVFRLSPHGILISRMDDGKILDVNEGFQLITGYEAILVTGRTASELKLYPNPWDEDRLLEHVVAGEAQDLEIQICKRGGEAVTCLLSSEIAVLAGQRVILTCLTDITNRKRLEMERERIIQDLQIAQAEVKTLSGLLAICAACKKVRDDEGHWNQIEAYVSSHTTARFTHGMCPDCAQVYFKR